MKLATSSFEGECKLFSVVRKYFLTLLKNIIPLHRLHRLQRIPFYLCHQEKAGPVTVLSVGIIIYPRAFWLAASPDRRVYDGCDKTFGLLEVKCPDMREKDCLEEQHYTVTKEGQCKWKVASQYLYQVQMQLAVTGVTWTDFYVWSTKATHLLRIFFDPVFGGKVQDNADEFYFTYFL